MRGEMVARGLRVHADGATRCYWAGSDDTYRDYHDSEWGYPVDDDRRLFEKICLEGFQAGLSWIMILRKRENFRRAFQGFDFERVARFNQRSVARLLGDAGIVRHRGKIESVINNAKRACKLRDERGSLAAYFWSFEPERGRREGVTYARFRKTTESKESVALSRDLKRRGWSFVGPTTAYAFMQAMGLVDDHIDGCVIAKRTQATRRSFRRPV